MTIPQQQEKQRNIDEMRKSHGESMAKARSAIDSSERRGYVIYALVTCVGIAFGLIVRRLGR